jgi:hypothetical protein
MSLHLSLRITIKTLLCGPQKPESRSLPSPAPGRLAAPARGGEKGVDQRQGPLKAWGPLCVVKNASGKVGNENCSAALAPGMVGSETLASADHTVMFLLLSLSLSVNSWEPILTDAETYKTI